MKICCKCRTKKSEFEFGKNKNNSDGLQKYCKECKRKIARSWYMGSGRDLHLENVRRNNDKYRQIMQDFVWNYLKQHPCQLCGETDPIVLEFDHLDSTEKESEISRLMSNSTNINVLQKEIQKCQVLCGHCHKRKTAKEFNHWKYVKSISECPQGVMDSCTHVS